MDKEKPIHKGMKVSFVKRHYEEIVVGVIGWIAVMVTQLLAGQSATIEWQKAFERRMDHNEGEIALLRSFHNAPIPRHPHEDFSLRPKELIKPDTRVFRNKDLK